jgi:hypothetical protein
VLAVAVADQRLRRGDLRPGGNVYQGDNDCKRDVPGRLRRLVVATTLLAAVIDHVTRVTLTATHLRVHRGLWADDIPLSAVTRVTAESMSPWSSKATLLGVLLRRERDYASFGVREVLGVEWRDEKGRTRKTWARFEGAEAFRAQIEALRGGATGVRAAAAEAGEGEALEAEAAGSRAKAARRG